jgi:tetratricopeptide (TPR) repeat protein
MGPRDSIDLPLLKAPFSRAAGPTSPPQRSAVRAEADAGRYASRRADMTDAMRDAIDRCRRGSWKDGLPALARIAEQEERPGTLPALVYSYLGYGIALRQQRLTEGRKLCQHAVRLEFFQAENYLNLARTELLAGSRRAAVRALEEGLKIEPDSSQLLDLQREIGRRRNPVLPFLRRDNPLNLLLGRIRHVVLK